MTGSKPVQLLLVEDDENDIQITRRALARSDQPHTLSVAHDGEAALAALRAGPLPDLVFLDISLPKIDGFEVLRQIKADPDLAHLPVLMLTTSKRPEDVRRAYATGANAFVVKPMRFPAFAELMARTLHWWLSDSRLPTHRA